MKLFWQAPDSLIKLYHGDARFLDTIPDESIDLIFTSPPYWGKRSYGDETVAAWGGEPGCSHQWNKFVRLGISGGTASKKVQIKDRNNFQIVDDSEQAYCSLCGAWRGSLGLEPTWQLYIEHLLECAREWWRVLKKTGNLVINIGDTFATHTSKRSAQFGGNLEDGRNEPFTSPRPRQNYPEKMKLGIPHRLRFALNDMMGWVSRDDIIWYKGKEYPDGHVSKVAMPESVKDRLSCSYEMAFHFVKSKGNRCERYWFDLDSIRQPHLSYTFDENGTPHHIWGARIDDRKGTCIALLKGEDGLKSKPPHPSGANPGDVWIIQPEPFKLKHYAVWPSELCERVIKVASPKEVCPKCGKPRERIVERNGGTYGQRKAKGVGGPYNLKPEEYQTCGMSQGITIGWSDCGCNEGFVPGVTLDPFCGGSGRAARMARKLGRRFIGVDLKEDYLEMSRECYLQGETEEAKKQMEIGARQEVLL